MESMTSSSFEQPRRPGGTRLPHWIAGLSLLAVGLVAGWHLSGTPTLTAPGDSPARIVTMAQSAEPRALDGTQQSYAPVVQRVSPAVVKIDITGRARQERTQMQDLPPFWRDFFGPEFRQRRPPRVQGHGSGVIVNPSGHILTNHHVIEHADRINVTLADGQEVQAELVGSDPPTDLAVIRIPGKDLPMLPFADSDTAEVGDVVLAVGHPFHFGQSVSLGILSGKGRTTNLRSDLTFEDFLQTDAPINTGNSGGALVNTRGELIGIPSQIWTPTGGNIGIGFAVPSNMARHVMDQLLETGRVTRSQLGVFAEDPGSALVEALGLPSGQGAVVQEVQDGSPAERAGLQPEDFITHVNGQRIRDMNELRNVIAQQEPGSEVEVRYFRDGQEARVMVTLAERPTDERASREPGRDELGGGRLGVTVEPLTPQLASQLDATRDQGVVIADVDPDGPAAEAGLQRGVIIYEVNRQAVGSPQELTKAVADAGTGAIVLRVGYQGREFSVAVRPRE